MLLQATINLEARGSRVRRRWRALSIVLLLLATGQSILGGAAAGALPGPPRPPEQPVQGPGGRTFAYEAVEVRRVGRPPDGYWLFEPASLRLDAATPATGRPLPVVVFVHGFMALDPEAYRGWIDHIVRRGAIVVYPDYQTNNPFADDWAAYLPNAVGTLRAAFEELGRREGVPADLSRVALVGHSLGGVLATALAAVAADEGLPPAAVLMPVEPGGCAGCDPLPDDRGVPLPPLDGVPASALTLVVVGEDDDVVGDDAARRIWAGLAHVPLARRDYVTLRSDHHGWPPLRATHLQPQTDRGGGRVDALDFYGTWKLFDLLMGCAFAGAGCDDALGNTEAQRDMGVWSDGEPVAEPLIRDGPGPEED